MCTRTGADADGTPPTPTVGANGGEAGCNAVGSIPATVLARAIAAPDALAISDRLVSLT